SSAPSSPHASRSTPGLWQRGRTRRSLRRKRGRAVGALPRPWPVSPEKPSAPRERRNLALSEHVGGGAEAHERAAPLPQLCRLLLLDDAVDPSTLRRVEDTTPADPEGDVVCSPGRTVRNEVSGAEIGLRQSLARRLLLVRVPGHESATRSKRHVDEA